MGIFQSRAVLAAFLLNVLIFSMFVVAVYFSSGRGGRAYFSSYTLEYRSQWEYTVGFGEYPIYRSRFETRPNVLLDYLREQGFAEPEHPAGKPWELIFHYNQAWHDGYGMTYRVFDRVDNIVEWSRASPEISHAYWREFLTRLRSNRDVDRWVVSELVHRGRGCESVTELNQLIAKLESEASTFLP